jgi:hypothetical protein
MIVGEEPDPEVPGKSSTEFMMISTPCPFRVELILSSSASSRRTGLALADRPRNRETSLAAIDRHADADDVMHVAAQPRGNARAIEIRQDPLMA